MCHAEPDASRHSPTPEGIAHELDAFFRAVEHASRRDARDGTALLQPLEATAAAEHLDELCRHIRRLALDVESTGSWHAEESQERAQADVLRGSLDKMVAELRSLRSGRPGQVSWLQMARENSPAAIHAQPLDVSEFLKDALWKRAPYALSSATLATGTGAEQFAYVQESLGARTLHQVGVPSPFDYPKQCWMYLPEEGLHEGLLKGSTEAGNREYARLAAMHIQEVLGYTKGRAFLLFTSARQLGYTLDALRARDFRWPYITQGEMGQAETLEWFRSTPGAVLFGLASYSEGVDVPGEALSCVYLDRIPFPTPSDLLHEARLRALGGGVHAFRQLSVPLAITKMKQGFGRLIRTCTDRGVVILADPRLRGKHSAILQSLPPARRVSRLELRKHAELFLAGAGERREAQTEHERETLDLLRRLDIPHPEHAACARRFLELGALTEGLWGWAGRMARYYQNVSIESINVSERS